MADPLPREFGWRTIPDLLRARVADAEHAVALIASVNGKEQAVTRGELDLLSSGLATALRNRYGAEPGSRVAWLISNQHGGEALITYHAVARIGAVNVPVNTRLSVPEIITLTDHCGADVLIVEPGLLAALSDARILEHCRVLSIGAPEWVDALLAGRAADELLDRLPSEDDLACILYTSGTTGLPKGVEHTHASALAAGLAWCDAFSLSSDDVLQSPFPVYSGAGLHFNGLAALWAGATYVVSTPDADAEFRRIARYRSTVYTAVPSVYSYWLDEPALGAADLSSLRAIAYGGATMPTGTILALRQAFPVVELVQTYGSTEAGPGGTYLPAQYATSRLGSIGNRVAGRFNRVKVVDDGGREVSSGQMGELLLSGASMMRGYHRDPEATASVLQDGWVRSGDVVRYDEEGFLYFVDRKRDIIVRGGANISTFEVEEVLLQHPAVSEAAVFGTTHPRLGEQVCAAVVLAAGRSVEPAGLIEHCRTRLADFKVPSRVTTRASLPRNAGGKVLKRLLVDQGEDDDPEGRQG